MSLNVTLYPEENSSIEVGYCHIGIHGRAFVTVNVDGARIQTNRWEDAQRLVDALTTAIANARHAEQAATLTAIPELNRV